MGRYCIRAKTLYTPREAYIDLPDGILPKINVGLELVIVPSHYNSMPF